MSTQILVSTIDLTSFKSDSSVSNSTIQQAECDYTDGNGYLFVFHPNLDSFYCIYNAGTITGNRITVQIRDTIGIPEGFSDTLRPTTTTNAHNYNLFNQGWSNTPAWTAEDTTTSQLTVVGSHAFTVASGLAITPGDNTRMTYHLDGNINMVGTVTSYIGTTLTINVTAVYGIGFGASLTHWDIINVDAGRIDTWFAAIGNYPSNSDVWWYFKNSSGNFDPSGMIDQVTVSGPAPKGSFILTAFNQSRTGASGSINLTDVTTTVRPKTGCWFSGRIWYSGVDASFAASGTAPFSTWTETIYFSQIIEKVEQFGRCFQVNDPTSENLFDLLPSDGGTIVIQGCGSIYKLFPVQNGLIVFAANGIWFVTGSQGIGFTANDYTVTKIANVQAISGKSFINVQGYPVFWNEEGIYTVIPGQQGGLQVTNLCLGTILSFYEDIPLSSKKYARGDYDPINYIIQWVYKDEEETNINSRYEYNRVLNFNTNNKSFYPWSIAQSTGHRVHDVKFIQGPGGSTSPSPVLKYSLSLEIGATHYFSFAEERDTIYLDWGSADYTSFFITGYKLHGQAQRRFEPTYIYMYSRADTPTAYKLRGIWNFANSGDSGKYSSEQLITNALSNFGMIFRRHRIRGSGLSL